MFVRVVILVGVVNATLLTHVLVPFTVMAIVAGAFAAWLYFRDGTSGGMTAKGELEVENPFSLTEAAKFGAVFAVVLLVVKLVQNYFPPQGMYFVAALAGLTDVDAITLSMAEFGKTDAAAVPIAVISIVIAAVSNTLVKCGLAVGLGGQAFGRNLMLATAATLVAGLAAALLL
jgi:uncharacterized membrane protein (DUF4010 family)